jgi:hypothetical protein
MSSRFATASGPAGRVKPRISANKLAEYLVCRSAARRREIIRDQWNPPDFKSARYTDACNAIVRFFAKGQNRSMVTNCLNRLETWKPGVEASKFVIQKNRDCRDALASFLKLIESSAFAALAEGGLIMTIGPSNAPKLTKAGVAISVRPELLIRGVDPKKGPFVGALKLHASKSIPMDENAAAYVGTLLREYGELHLAAQAPCDYRRCFVLDIFGQKIYPAPKAIVKRQSEIVSA